MSEPTDADRNEARHMITSPGMWEPDGTWQENLIACVAHGLAAERDKARAPFLALAEQLEREGHHEESEAIRYGEKTTAESWWGSAAASLDAAARIRRAAE